MNDVEASIPMEVFLYQAFEENFERLRLKTGRSIAPNVKDAALRQVLLYWRKLRSLAERVDETEIKLTIPEQRTPAGRTFTLEGVVDIVHGDDGRTTMFDLKTHLEAADARADLDPYAKQLALYGHIWQGLRGKELDGAALIASNPPRLLRRALELDDDAAFTRELERWDPIVELPVSRDTVDEVVRDFGEVVDAIEDGRFAAPTVETLLAPTGSGRRSTFGYDVCRNCDARFSCSSYRQYVQRRRPNSRMAEALLEDMEDYGHPQERDAWTDANLPTDGRSRFGALVGEDEV